MLSYSCSTLMKTCTAQLNPSPHLPPGEVDDPVSGYLTKSMYLTQRFPALCPFLTSISNVHTAQTTSQTMFHTILQPHNYSYSFTLLPPPRVYREKTMICFSQSQKASTNFKHQDMKHTHLTSSVLTFAQISPTWQKLQAQTPLKPYKRVRLKKL